MGDRMEEQSFNFSLLSSFQHFFYDYPDLILNKLGEFSISNFVLGMKNCRHFKKKLFKAEARVLCFFSLARSLVRSHCSVQQHFY